VATNDGPPSLQPSSAWFTAVMSSSIPTIPSRLASPAMQAGQRRCRGDVHQHEQLVDRHGLTAITIARAFRRARTSQEVHGDVRMPGNELIHVTDLDPIRVTRRSQRATVELRLRRVEITANPSTGKPVWSSRRQPARKPALNGGVFSTVTAMRSPSLTLKVNSSVSNTGQAENPHI